MIVILPIIFVLIPITIPYAIYHMVLKSKIERKSLDYTTVSEDIILR